MNENNASESQVDTIEPNMDDVDAHGYRRPLAPSADDVDGHSRSPQSRLTDDYVRPGRPGPHSQRSAADTEDDVQGHVGFDDEVHLKR